LRRFPEISLEIGRHRCRCQFVHLERDRVAVGVDRGFVFFNEYRLDFEGALLALGPAVREFEVKS